MASQVIFSGSPTDKFNRGLGFYRLCLGWFRCYPGRWILLISLSMLQLTCPALFFSFFGGFSVVSVLIFLKTKNHRYPFPNYQDQNPITMLPGLFTPRQVPPDTQILKPTHSPG
jgi:hypothetical protein